MGYEENRRITKFFECVCVAFVTQDISIGTKHVYKPNTGSIRNCTFPKGRERCLSPHEIRFLIGIGLIKLDGTCQRALRHGARRSGAVLH